VRCQRDDDVGEGLAALNRRRILSRPPWFGPLDYVSLGTAERDAAQVQQPTAQPDR
jgi:hypothetical protein